jgi:hypothetical protein
MSIAYGARDLELSTTETLLREKAWGFEIGLLLLNLDIIEFMQIL